MKLSEIKEIYFLGIGGIGMSALARYFLASGKKVSGYDKTPTPLTDELIKEGAEIHFEDRPDLIPSNIDLVILTPAIPSSLNELHFVEKLDVPLLKRSEVLGEISKDKFTIAVAGTHGKTTISSMIAHIFKCANADFTAIIGGIATNYNSNFIGNKNGEILIVEADEFDRSFLTLYPDIAVISSVDADHLDIYGTKDSVDKSFQLFADQIKENGSLVLKSGLAIQKENKLYTYSLSDGENFKAISIEHQNEKFEIKFDLNGLVVNASVKYPGKHNIENALAASAVAKLAQIPEEKIKEALESYSGVKRRFETIYQDDKIVYIDDYAHHPKELNATIGAVKEMYSDKKLTGIFQPHLFTRTRDFADDFAKSLEELDVIILMEIYPAREEAIAGINSKFLLDKIDKKEKYLMSSNEIFNYLNDNTPECLLSLGAGNIDKLVEPIKAILSEKSY